MAIEKNAYVEKDLNKDPITGEPGAHPLGVGAGAASAGAAGAVIGSVVGPIGTVAGAVIGAVAGGLAGKGVAESIDPTAEDAYWRTTYHSRPYVTKGTTYEEYEPAYRYGWESRSKHQGKSFDQVETELQSSWNTPKNHSLSEWNKARPVVRDAWDHFDD